MPPYALHEIIPMIIGVVFIGCATGVIMELIKYRSTRGASGKALEAYEKRLARVEVALDDLTQSINRVTEGQEFLTNVLSERGELPALPPRR